MIDIGVLLIAVIVVVSTIIFFNKELTKEKDKMSIKESLELTQMPVVTFFEGDVKLNFVLDTGSSHSHISKSVAEKLTGEPVDIDYSFSTGSGSGSCSKMLDVILRYKNKRFNTSVFINEALDNSFEEVKKNSGVQLHGILGSDFLVKYKYILNFAELVAYHK